MELTYPINLIGIEDGETSGDVITRDGEFLGTWALTNNDHDGTATLEFVPDGEQKARFTEIINFPESGMSNGMAIRNICASIRDWCEAQTS